MKNIFRKLVYILTLSGSLFAMTACSDYLDVSSELADNLDLETVFNTKAYMQRWHKNIFNCIARYDEMGGGVNGTTGAFTGGWNLLAGEITARGGSAYTALPNGFTSDSAPFHRWGALYKVIRQAAIFIENAKPLGNIETSTSADFISEADVNRMKTEAQFFIAYSYFSLFELYGPVPIVQEIIDPDNTNIPDYPRATVDEMLNYIDQLLVEVIDSGNLPETTFVSGGQSTGDPTSHNNEKYNLTEIVRPTKTLALALRAKLWVYAASPLFNGGYQEAMQLQNPDGTQIFPAYDANKWVTAKKHLETFLEYVHSMGYALYRDKDDNVHKSIYELYQYYTDEIIWATPYNHYYSIASNMEPRTNPRDLDGTSAWGNVGVFQESVDAFFTANGLEIEEDPEYSETEFASLKNITNEDLHTDPDINSMYHNREPRFYASVVYQGRSWHVQPQNKPNYTVGFAKGQGCDRSKNENPWTGYLLYKFKNRSMQYFTRAASGGKPAVVKQWSRPNILMRLADFYLYYAEVCNEIDPSDPKIIEYVDKIRKRAGIPGYKELANNGIKNIIGDQKKQRWAIQRERQVELFCEGQRYFDIRRWMTADDKNNKRDQQLFRTGMDMTAPSSTTTGSGSFYNRVIVETRAWTRAMLLYPIPYNEIQMAENLRQNPLW